MLNPIVQKRELTPDSPYYLDIKAACLRGDYLEHFVERSFRNFDNAEQIFLYKYSSNDYNVQQAYQMIKEDLPLLKHKEGIILFNVSDANIMVDDCIKVMDTFDNMDLTLSCGVKKKVEILFLFC